MTFPVHTAVFLKSVKETDKAPPANMPEYAFIGRSNVGKSSLINMITNRKNLAKTSSTPGKTQLINFFLINESWYLADLPGYGYAKRSKADRESWGIMIRDYLIRRKNLVCVFILLDVRLEPQSSDIDFIHWLGSVELPFVLVFTKADKLGKMALRHNIEHYQNFLLQTWEELPQMFITSVTENRGRGEILDFINRNNGLFRESFPQQIN